MGAYLESEYDLYVWHPIEFGFEGNEMRLHGLRHFEKTHDDRDFKLGSNRMWTVGFYDYNTGAGAWSDNLELVLDSGFDLGYLEELEAEPQPIERGEEDGGFYAVFDAGGIGPNDCS